MHSIGAQCKMEVREPFVDISQSENKAGETDSNDVVARLVNRIKELEQKVYGSHFLQNMWEGSGKVLYPSLSYKSKGASESLS